MEILRTRRAGDIPESSVIIVDGTLYVVEQKTAQRVTLIWLDKAGLPHSGDVDPRAELEIVKLPIELAFDYIMSNHSAQKPA